MGTALETAPGILLIGSSQGQTRQMQQDLAEAGYSSVVAHTTQAALSLLSQTSPALIVVDRLLGNESGLVLCQTLRSQGVKTPILLLMVRDNLEDRISCLESGADDYYLKPYQAEAFLKIVRLYLQSSPVTAENLRFADLVLDLSDRHAIRNGRVIDLTMKEFELLKYLMEHPREVLSRDQILENVWGYDFLGESNVIEVYVRYLRLKIDGEDEKRLIQTVRGVGYVLREG
ncbi:MAG: response regulator transcription factor [Nodosilinea sp. LVE1205-7]|jgi:OmpR family response regulator NblR